jgi:hypothetical protein
MEDYDAMANAGRLGELFIAPKFCCCSVLGYYGVLRDSFGQVILFLRIIYFLFALLLDCFIPFRVVLRCVEQREDLRGMIDGHIIV